MTFKSKLAVALCALALAVPVAHAEVSPVKRAQISRLMDLTGVLNLSRQMSAIYVQQMGSYIRSNNPDVSTEVLDALPEVVAKVFDEQMPTLISLCVPLYDKYFTERDLQQLIAFYESDIGKKSARVMPQMMGESAQIGAQWGQSLAPLIAQRLRERFKAQDLKI